MTLRDGREILRWAILSGALVFVGLGARTANSGQEPQPVRPMLQKVVDGVQYQMDARADAQKGVVHVKILVTNQNGARVQPRIAVQSLDRTFTGSPFARSQRPEDFKEVVVAESTKSLRLAASAKTAVDFTLKFHAPSDKSDPTKPIPEPAVGLSVDGKRVLMTYVVLGPVPG